MHALTFKPGANGELTFARRAPNYVDAEVLAANTAASHTVPTGAKFVIFSSDGDFYARPNADPAVPAQAVADGSAGELNPTIWDLNGVTTIRLVAAATRIVTLTFYADRSS
jgi:hypothetical protein